MIDSEAYTAGLDAGVAGMNDSDNPYKIGTDEAMDWEDGRAAASGEED